MKVDFKYYNSIKSKIRDKVKVNLDMTVEEWKKLKPMILHNHTVKHNRRKEDLK